MHDPGYVLRRIHLPRTRVNKVPADALGFSGWHHVLVEKDASRGVVVLSSILIRIGGVAAIVSGVLFVAALLLGRSFPKTMENFMTMETFLIIALLLVPVGMVGFHALQSRSYGGVGHTGFWMAVVGPLAVALGAGSYLWWGRVFGSSLLWLALPVGPLVLLVGLMLYGIATLRATVLPRWCGVVFIVAMPAALASSIVGAFASVFMVFGLAWLALGYMLWARREVRTEQPARVR
jgi:hypothetical protein